MNSVKKDTPEILKLIFSAQSGNEKAVASLIKHYSSYFEYMVSTHSKKTLIKDDDDLRSYIYMGFLEGLKRFDSTRNTTFIYYTHIWMKKHIFEAESTFRFVRLPVNQSLFYTKYMKGLKNKKIEVETIDDLDIDYDDIAKIDIIESSNTVTFTSLVSTEDELDCFNLPNDVFEAEALKEEYAQQKKERIENLKNNINSIFTLFSTKERFILEHAFGLNNKSKMTFDQIAESLDVTKANIIFTKNRLIRLMRHASISNVLLKEVF